MHLFNSTTKQILEDSFNTYNSLSFIEEDPISIPHKFKVKEDIEIAGFLVATISWGQRKTILNNGQKLIELMDMEPYNFIMQNDFNKMKSHSIHKFVHRTFNGDDLIFFFKSIQSIYKTKGGMEALFSEHSKNEDAVKLGIENFRKVFLKNKISRTSKHISNPMENSACKRLNMFLRWMVRRDNNGVDFGIWKHLKPHQLLCPLDVHSGNVARKLGLLSRTQNDWKATEELTNSLKLYDPKDPVKYDFSLFGLGVNKVI